MKTIMKIAGRRKPAMPLNPNSKKDRDEDLLLFRELHKREKDRMATSLLHPVSEEFEAIGDGGNRALYRISSGKIGSGNDFLAEGEKNDYNWLKTPPGTPLFPSLEMEATGPLPVDHHELPIHQPLSRFARNTELPKERIGVPESPKERIGVPESPKSKPKVPSRSTTPSNRPTDRSIESQKLTQKSNYPNSKRTPNYSNQKFPKTNSLTSNLPQSADSKVKPRSRGVSPSVRSTIPAHIPGFSNEAPTNLRSASATRGRPAANPVVAVNKKWEHNTPMSRRSSCSPSVTRGRRLEPKNQEIRVNESQILGSKIVDRIMSARKSNADERGGQLRSPRDSVNGNKGIGRMTAKNSLETAPKQSEIKGDRSSSRSRSGSVPVTCSRKG